MKAFTPVESHICPLDAADVDTDQIIPKQFLKRTERTGFGPFAFNDWRYDADGNLNPEFPMNQPEHQDARILLAGRNFGCGSSREHAPWALFDAGFEVIIASSFADIFRNNCLNTGILTVALPEAQVRELFSIVGQDSSWQLRVDLEAQSLSGEGFEATFAIDPHTKHRLLEGLDAIDLSMRHEDEVDAYEARRQSWRPVLSATPTPS